MFVLALLKQTVRVPADKFKGCFKENQGLDLDVAIKQQLNKKLANKVVPNVGLCIALWDIVERKQSFMLPGDSGHHTQVTFRFLVFRPFINQILVGRIKSCDHESVRVTLGFFDDIVIPADQLQQTSVFDGEKQEWIWKYPTDDGTHDLYMEKEEEIRFKVTSELFSDTTPTEKPTEKLTEKPTSETSYKITATIKDPGLGPLKWWAPQVEEDNGE